MRILKDGRVKRTASLEVIKRSQVDLETTRGWVKKMVYKEVVL